MHEQNSSNGMSTIATQLGLQSGGIGAATPVRSQANDIEAEPSRDVAPATCEHAGFADEDALVLAGGVHERRLGSSAARGNEQGDRAGSPREPREALESGEGKRRGLGAAVIGQRCGESLPHLLRKVRRAGNLQQRPAGQTMEGGDVRTQRGPPRRARPLLRTRRA